MAYYNWENILKSKTNDELIEFCRNDFIDTEGILFALDELERRKYNHIKFIKLGEELLNSRIKIMHQIQKENYRGYILKYSPYTNYALSLFGLVLFLISRLQIFFLITSIMFAIIGSISFFTSKIELKKIEKERNKKIEEIDKILYKITTHNNRTKASPDINWPSRRGAY